MIFKRFTFIITVLVILMGISMFLFFWSLEVEHLKFSVYGFAFIALLLLFVIIKTVRRNNYWINRFLENYVVNEGSPKYSAPFKGSSFQAIEKSLNRISKLYGEVKTEKEAEHLFLQHLIDEINVGVLVYDDSGRITLKNKSFTHIFNVKASNNIDALKFENGEVCDLLKESVGKNPTVIRLMINQERLILSVSVSRFLMHDKIFNLALFQNVTNEISQEEVESWQKLIKILRHEIINSLTPIATLSSTLIDNFDEVDYKKTFEGENYKTIETNYKGLKAIEKRSEGLMEFIKAYKELSSNLKPDLKEVNVSTLLNQLKELVSPEFEKMNIKLYINMKGSSHFLFIDEKQIMQVLLNLVKNGVEAIEKIENAQIGINYNSSPKENCIEIIDNGSGISLEEQEKIFIPFYSTKKNGSGIGLSLSKQIMYLHKGDIKVYSRSGKTVFRLLFANN